MNKCKTCGRNSQGEYCFLHKRKTAFSKGIPKNKEDINKMHEFFKSIWNKRPHRSELSNSSLGNEILTIFFHHILPKNKYKELAFDEDNVIMLTFQEHQNVENNMYRYPEINNRRNNLKIKYGL